jgi:hypothetical protein
MHPVIANSYPEGSKDEFERHNYTISYTAVEDCGFLDCPLCYREIEILQQPELLTVGLSRFDPSVLEQTKKYRNRRKQKKLNHLKLMRLALQAMEVSQTIMKADDDDDDDDDDRAV